MTHGEGTFSWEVYQAEGRRAYPGAPRPTASIHVTDADGNSEFIDIPASVGRRLASMKKQGQVSVNSKGALCQVLNQCTEVVAWEQLVKLFDRRDYSDAECVQKLRLAGFKRDAANAAVAKGVDCGLISNVRYADAFIRSKVNVGWGIKRIERELSKRGIQTSELVGWPYDYIDPDDEFERAMDVASRKTVRDPNKYAKLVRFLVGRGFSYDVAGRAARVRLTDE